MNLIVVGCGRAGTELAYRLYQRGHRVTVVDHVAAAFENLPPDFQGRTVQGEALNQDVLHRAGITHADGLAAVTNSDSLNAVVAHLAHATYHITNVVIRNYDPRWRPIHEATGMQVVSSTSWGAHRIEQLLYQSEIRPIFSAGNGEVEIYGFTVPPAWQGRKLAQLVVAGQPCLAVAITRAGRAELPSPDACLQEGDVVHISATPEGVEVLRKRLARKEEA